MTGHISRHAASYAAEGFHVVKLVPGTNRPFEKGWQLAGNRLTAFQAEEAWTRWPAMNIGVVAWPRYWVLDLDGPDAVAWFEALAGQRCSDVTMTITTPGRSGGRHLWWQAPELPAGVRMRRSVQGCAKAEIKHGPGHQTAMPPSSRPEGAYAFVADGAESPASTPAWLMDRIVRRAEPTGVAEDVGWMAKLACEDSEWGRAAGMALAGTVDSICRHMAMTRVDRNNVLFWCAMRLIEAGAGDDALIRLGAAASLTGLDDDEINSTIMSAKAGAR